MLKDGTVLRDWLERRSPEFRSGLRNSVYNTADHLLLPLLWLGFTPVFVHSLGLDAYGVWMLVNALVGASGLMAFGLTDATIKFVAGTRGTRDHEAAAVFVRVSLAIYSATGVITAAIGVACAGWLVESVFRIQSENQAEAMLAIRFGCVGIAFRFVDSVFQSTMQGFERYDLSARVNLVANLATFIAQLVLAMQGEGLALIVAAGLAVAIPATLWRIIIVRRDLLPGVSLKPKFERAALRRMMGFGFFSWIQGIGGILLGQLDRFLIASLIGTAALGYYAICYQLAQQIHVVIARAVAFLFPVSAVLAESGQHARLRRAYWKGMLTTTVAATALGIPIFLLADPILALWVSDQVARESSITLRILAFAFAAYGTTVVPYYLLNGAGFVWLSAVSGLVNGVLVAAATGALLPVAGIAGAASAKLATFPISFVSRAILHYRVLDDQRWYVGILALVPLVLAFGIGLGVVVVTGWPGRMGVMSLILLGFGCAIVGGIVAYLGVRLLFRSHPMHLGG